MNRDRLSSVMRIRQIQERSARGTLAGRRRELRAAETAEQQTWTALDARSPGDGSDAQPAAVLLAHHGVIGAGVLAAARQHETTTAAEGAVESAVHEWTVAARRVEGLQRLAERHRALEHDDLVRRTANEIDDLVLVRFTGDHV